MMRQKTIVSGALLAALALSTGCGSMYAYYIGVGAATLETNAVIAAMDDIQQPKKASIFYLEPGVRVIQLRHAQLANQQRTLILNAQPNGHYQLEVSNLASDWRVRHKNGKGQPIYRWCDEPLSCKQYEPPNTCVLRFCGL